MRVFNPALFIVKVSNFCNLSCEYCYVNKDSSILEKQDLEKIAFLISKWIINMRLNKVKIGFLGGEPLLHIDKLEFFIRTLNKKLGAFRDKVIYSLQTNCVNISEKVIEFISEKQIKLGVSLDGPKEIHDKARIFPNGRGSYQLIVKNLKLT